jgi:NAD(P)-dependent dehydrogenase (short-subunit alcohol dehydrogenase family)
MKGQENKTWLITGASRGLGRAFTEEALARGENVVATARQIAPLDELVRSSPETLLVLEQDVTRRAQAEVVVRAAIDHFGTVDVLVNNAGYGLVGTIEELDEAQVRRQVDTNFLGALWMSQAVLPHMRAARRGDIVQISTVGAVGTMPAFGLYNASKWALEGFSEAMAAEVSGFGIRVTIAELGGFATDWAWGSLDFAKTDSAYDPLRESVFGTADFPWDMAGQATDTSGADPALAATTLMDHLESEGGPLRLIVGDDAPGQVRIALERRRDDYLANPGFNWPGSAPRS